MRLDDPRATLLNQPETFGPGTLIVLASETVRFSRFAVDFQAVGFNMPPGSSIKWMMGSDIAESRNQAVEEMEGDWIWFVDDDHAFRPDLLLKLLARNVDVVTPLVLRRNQPFWPVPGVDGNFLDLQKYRPGDLVEVETAGASGMLVRKRVLDALEAPWFELGHEGRLPVSEDVMFCRRVREAGYKIHVDMGARMGHLTTAAVWPTFSEEHDRWLTGFTIADGAEVAIDAAEMPVLEETSDSLAPA